MEITRIPDGKYRIGKYVLNKNEVIQYQLEILKKERPGNVSVKCLTTGGINFINNLGKFTECFPKNSPWSKETSLQFDLITINREILAPI